MPSDLDAFWSQPAPQQAAPPEPAHAPRYAQPPQSAAPGGLGAAASSEALRYLQLATKAARKCAPATGGVKSAPYSADSDTDESDDDETPHPWTRAINEVRN